MTKQKNTEKKPVILKVDKQLDKYLDKGLFKEKIEKANEVLRTVGLPDLSK